MEPALHQGFPIYRRRTWWQRLICLPVAIPSYFVNWGLRLARRALRAWGWLPRTYVVPLSIVRLRNLCVWIRKPRAMSSITSPLDRVINFTRLLATSSSSLMKVGRIRTLHRTPVVKQIEDVRPSDRVAVKRLERDGEFRVGVHDQFLLFSGRMFVYHDEITSILMERMNLVNEEQRLNLKALATSLSSCHNGDSLIWAEAAPGSHFYAYMRLLNSDINAIDGLTSVSPSFRDPPHTIPTVMLASWSVAAIASVRWVWMLWSRRTPHASFMRSIVAPIGGRLFQSLLASMFWVSGHLFRILAISLAWLTARCSDFAAQCQTL